MQIAQSSHFPPLLENLKDIINKFCIRIQFYLFKTIKKYFEFERWKHLIYKLIETPK